MRAPRFTSVTSRSIFQSLLLLISGLAFVGLTACGGGGGSSGQNLAGTCTISCDPVDVSSYLGYSSDGGDAGVGGAGGAAGDGLAIANRPITLTDALGAVKTSTTGADGTFYFNVTGMTSPLVVQVTKADGTVRMSFTRVKPTVGKTISISVSGLSDKIASDVVKSVDSSKTGSANLTPAMVTQAASIIPKLITDLNAGIASKLTENGLDPKTFDPLTYKLEPAIAAGAAQNNYDKVLDSLAITSGTSTKPTQILAPLEAAKALFKNLRDTTGAYSKTDNTGDLDVADKKLKDAAHAAISPVDVDTLRILGGFFKAESMYSQYKSGASTTTNITFGQTQYGQTLAKDVFGNTVSPSSLASYGCEVKKVSLLTDETIDLANTRISSTYIIGGTQSSPTYSTALTTSQVNGFNCYSIGAQGRLSGTLLNDGMHRVNTVFFLPQSDGTYKYVSHTRKYAADQTGLFSTAISSYGSGSTIDGTPKKGTLTPVRDSGGNITSFTITGDLRPGFTNMPDRTVATWQKYAGYSINLTATETSGGTGSNTTLTQTFSGTMALNKADGTVASTATIGTGSTLTETLNVVTGTQTASTGVLFMGSTPCPAGHIQTGVAPNIYCQGTTTSNVYNRVISSGTLNVAIAAPGIKVEGVISLSNPSEDKVGTADTSLLKYYQPTNVALTGKIYDTDSAGAYRLFFDGTVSATTPGWSTFDSKAPETSTNFLKKNLGLDGKLYLVNRPVVKLKLDVAQTGYRSGTTTGSFIWSDATGYPLGFTMTGAYDDVANTGSMTFKSSDVNATFTMPRNGNATAQNILVNNIKQGTITLKTKRIDYIDGAFEQF